MERYELFQGSEYISGRKVDWEAIMVVDFGAELKNLLKNMDWLGLTNLSEMHYSPHLVNEFYSGILLKKESQALL